MEGTGADLKGVRPTRRRYSERLAVPVSPDQHAWVLAVAALNHLSCAEIVRQALERFMTRPAAGLRLPD